MSKWPGTIPPGPGVWPGAVAVSRSRGWCPKEYAAALASFKPAVPSAQAQPKTVFCSELCCGGLAAWGETYAVWLSLILG